jgi:peptide/nickel transport system permease protein
MTGVVLRRLAWALGVTWFVVTVTFALVAAIPANPEQTLLGPHASDPDSIAHVREHYCLDRGAVVQYGCWLENLAHGDLGVSYRTKRPITELLADRVWPTAQLALAAIALQLLVGVPLGIAAAMRRGRWPDRIATILAAIAQSAPPFVVGTVLLYVLAFRFDLLPIAGYGDGVLDRLRHLAIPAMTLATFGAAYYARVVRSELGDSLRTDYVRTARAKGLGERAVVLRHGLRPALGPLVTLVGIDLGILIGGAAIVEAIFAWPGLGREILQAIIEVDMPLILGVVIVTSIAIAIANLLADLVLAWLDPRLRGTGR